MKLEYKPDFERASRQWSAFWAGESERPLIGAVVERPGVKPVDMPRYLLGRDGNFQPVIDQLLGWADTHEFIGEAIPYFSVEWGPDTFSAFLGADLTFSPEDEPCTSWCVPFVEDWDDAELRFQTQGHWWQLTLAFFKELRRQCDGRLLINPPTLVANLDSLAAIRGAENLLMDLINCPEQVEAALDKICRIHDEVLQAYAKELDFASFGSVSVEGTYSAGSHSRPQCDISCMLSPAMFREFALPSLRREAAAQDAVAYHLDGSGAIRHLEALCEIEKLGAICFVPSDGNDRTRDWTPLFERIDALGKGQIIPGLRFEQIRRLWERFESRTLFCPVSATTKTEAEDMIAKAENLRK